MTKVLREKITERCGRCAHGGLELQPVHNVMTDMATCFYWAHPGIIGGCGSEWAIDCTDFFDTGKVGRVKRTVVLER